MMKTANLAGKQYGLLKVLYQVEDSVSPKGQHRPMWLCECQCENHTRKIVNGYALKSGHTKSCGCLSILANKRNKKYNTYDLTNPFGIGYTRQGDIFYFDKEDYDKIKNYCWNKDTHGYIKTLYEGSKIYLHRLIMGLEKNQKPKKIVDHINHNRNDNRKNNLRITDSYHNNMNSILRKDNTTKVKGVFWYASRNKWQVRITVCGKKIHLGYYTDFNEAVRVRKQAEKKYFGEYGYDNSMKIAKQNSIQ